MNKRILSVLLVVTLLVVGCIFAVQADLWTPTDDEITYYNSIAATYPTMAEVQAVGTGYCPVCQRTDVTWEALPTSGGALSFNKHYYVAADITTDTVYTTSGPSTTDAKKPETTVCIHLNGKNITATGTNAIFQFGVRGTVNLIGSGVVTGNGNDDGSSSTLRGATINSQAYLSFFGGTYKHAATTDNATLFHRRAGIAANIYSGTVFDADQTETQTVYGSNIWLRMGTINMYGGTIQNGNHELNEDASTNGTNGIQTFGGNVQVGGINAVTAATFNMYGGTIQNGKAGKGGNVALQTVIGSAGASASFNMYGGTITGGEATSRGTASTGGNVYVDARQGKCTFAMHGGTVSNGTTSGIGGNFAVIGTTTTYLPSITVDQSKGTSLITGGQANHGGNFVVGAYSKLSVSAGTISGGLAGGADSDVNYGGNVYVYAAGTEKTEFYLTGGTIKDGKADKGGNVAINAAKAETTIGGTISGGNHNTTALGSGKQIGGNLYVAKGLVIVKNGTITGGRSRDGGNIGIEGTATATVYLQNATVSDGTARYAGGNIYMTGETTLDLGRMDYATSEDTEKTLITGGTISGGTATTSASYGYGGNIHIAGGTLNLKKGTVTNGVASKAAGNLYVTGGTVNISGADLTEPQANTGSSSYSSNIYQTAGTINHTAGTVSGGTGVNGGNASIAGNDAVYTLNGGTVEGGYASSHGNNLYLRAGTLELLGGTINNNTTEVEDGDYEGNSAYVGATASNKVAKLVLGGAMTINTGDYLSDVYVNTQATGLVVKDDFTGDVHITIAGGSADPIIRPSSGYYGYHIGSEYEKIYVDDKDTEDTTDDVVEWTATPEFGATGAYTGKLTLQTSKSTSVSVFPVANGATEGNTHDLVIASVRGTKTEGEETVQTWYVSAEDAIASGDDYFALFADAAFEIAEGETATVNLNGKNATVSGAGELLFWDAQDVEDKGAVTIADGSTVTLVNNSNNGKLVKNPQNVTYLTYTNEDGTYSSYKLSVKLTGVSLRPSTAGIYFRGLVTTEITGAAAEEFMGGFGIVVSRHAQPDENFAENPDQMWWTEFTAADLDGEEKTGVEVTGIFKEGEDNATRGQLPVYAAAYATVMIGEDIVTIIDEVDTTGYSLYKVMSMMEDNETVWTNHGDALNAFYNTWADGLESWEFDKIGK